MGNKKKLSIICFSGDSTSLSPRLRWLRARRRPNYEVHMFFTFWGLNAVKRRKGRWFAGKGLMARTFGFLMADSPRRP